MKRIALGLGLWLATFLVDACQAHDPPHEAMIAAFDSPNDALASAVCGGDEGAITRALTAGGDIKAIGRGGYTLIYVALACDRANSVQALLENGLDPDQPLPAMPAVPLGAGISPLSIASRMSSAETVRALLAGGANPSGPNGDNDPLFRAILDHKEANVYALVEHGADLSMDFAGERGRGGMFTRLALQGHYCVLRDLSGRMSAIEWASILGPVYFNDAFEDRSTVDTACKLELVHQALARTTLADMEANMQRHLAVEIREALEQRYASPHE